MIDAGRAAALDNECAIFVKYLTGRDLSADVAAAYRRAHEIGGAESGGVSPSLDSALLALAGAGPGLARIADSYAAIFARPSILRRKLVLLIAILESRGETSRAFDAPDALSPAAWIVRAIGEGIAFKLRLLASLALVAPLRLWFLIRGVPKRSRPAQPPR